MATLNFPDPNVQTSYTNPDTGITYEWNNDVWKSVRTAQTAPQLFVNAAGDNVTGNLTFGTDKIVLNATTGAATFASAVDATAFTINGIPIGGSSSQTIISDTMPTPTNYNTGTLWWNSESSDTSLYVLYQDPTGPNGDAGGKYWIEASPAPDSIGFDGTHTGDSTFTGNMNVTGSATFAGGDVVITGSGNVKSGDPDNSAGAVLSPVGQNFARQDGAGSSVAAYMVLNGGTTAADTVARINYDGSADFGTTGVSNSDQGSVKVFPVGRLQIDGMVPSIGESTSYFINCSNNGADKFIVKKDGSATFAGAIATTATNNAFYASAGYSGGEAAIRVENTNAGGDPYYLYCDSSDGKIAYIRTDGSATFAGTVNTGSWPNDASTSIGGGAYLARQDSSTSVVWKALSGGIGSSNVTSQILAAGNATFGHSSEQQVNLRPGQVGNGDAIWLQNSDNSRPFLVTAEGGAQFGPLNISSSTGYGAQVDMAANAATVKAQCQQTASQYTLLFAGYMGTNRNFHVSADGSAEFSGKVETIGDTAAFHVGTDKLASKVPFNIYDTSNNNATIARIMGDGSADFAGTLKATNNIVCDTTGSTNGLYIGDYTNGNYHATIFGNGNAVFGPKLASQPAISTIYVTAYQENNGGKYGEIIQYADRVAATATTSAFRLRSLNAPNNAYEDRLRITWDGSATFAGTVTESGSDRKFKENIVDAPAQLTEVSALQLRTWDWNDLTPGNEERNNRRSMGLVAQEAELIDSNLVYDVNEGEDTYKAVDYKVLTMKLLGAVKELAAEVAALKAS